MMSIAVSTENPEWDPYTDRAVRTLERALAALSLPSPEVSVWLCGEDAIQALNARWRDKSEPTDVLSFPQNCEELLGDLAVCMPVAERQAADVGHPVTTELDVLLIHGLLHLLGYDHQTSEETAEMRRMEAELLRAVGDGLAPAGLVERARGER